MAALGAVKKRKKQIVRSAICAMTNLTLGVPRSGDSVSLVLLLLGHFLDLLNSGCSVHTCLHGAGRGGLLFYGHNLDD